MIRFRELSRRQTLIAISIISLAILVGLSILLANQLGFTQSKSPNTSVTPGQISIEGVMVCLPHKNTQGPQTMECAYGLQSNSGDYYGLRNLDQEQLMDGTLSISTRVQVRGVVASPGNDEIYGVVGNITVESIEVISSAVTIFDLNLPSFSDDNATIQRSFSWV